MITFLICLALLITAYFTYARYLERVSGIDPRASVPCERLYDGVDYMPLSHWRIFLIQLLNIAGTGPIFGAILGAYFGPVAFLWITLGGIFIGAMHDFLSGVMLLRYDGRSLPELIGHYLGGGMRQFMRVASIFLMILVGAVFLMSPADILVGLCPSIPYMGWIWIILAYYFIATLLPIDKLIGRIYPLFGVALVAMAVGLLGVLLFGDYTIPELTSFRNYHANARNMPLIPTLCITIACGAISGFHATQSPLMARCMGNERQCRSVFYGSMISESIIALIWAAVGMAFFGGAEGLNSIMGEHGNSAAWAVNTISYGTLGTFGGILALLGVVAAPITTGDTAFRSARLIIADIFHFDQKSHLRRLLVAVPIFVVGYLLTQVDFSVIWRYFAWANQTLSVVTLWCIVLFLVERKRNPLLALLPALFMTFVCSSFVLISKQFFGMESRTAAYAIAGAITLVIWILVTLKMRQNAGKIRP